MSITLTFKITGKPTRYRPSRAVLRRRLDDLDRTTCMRAYAAIIYRKRRGLR